VKNFTSRPGAAAPAAAQQNWCGDQVQYFQQVQVIY
jgi:hypothetical protein